MIRITENTLARINKWYNRIFFELLGFFLSPDDRRYARNCERLFAFFQKLMDERKSGKGKSYDGSADLLSILLESEIYKNEPELIKYELYTFFLAGMKTI